MYLHRDIENVKCAENIIASQSSVTIVSRYTLSKYLSSDNAIAAVKIGRVHVH